MKSETYSNLIDSIEEYGIVFLTATGNIQRWNKGAEKILGYTAAEAEGKNISKFLPNESVEQLLHTKMLTNATTEGTLRFKERGHKKDGTDFWVDVVLTAHHNDSQDLIGFSAIVHDITTQQRQKQFDDSNLHALINNTHNMLWSVDRNYKLITANKAFNETMKQFIGKAIERGDDILAEGFTDEQLKKFKDRYDRAFAGETFMEVEYTPPPYEYWSEISFHPMMEDGVIVGSACQAHGITNRVRAERKIIQLNRLYAFISQINNAIVHAVDEQALFHEVCRVAIEVGKFKVAWLGIVDKVHKTINLVEQCGFTQSIVHKFSRNTYEANGPTDVVVRTGSFYVCNNVEADLALEGWKTVAMLQGFRSCMVLPLKRSGEIFGTFNLYAEEIDYFDSEEKGLLIKATEDISFALDAFENERLRISTEEKLKHSERRLNQSQEVAHFGSWELNFATGVVLWSDEACRVYGLTPKENKQSYSSWISFIHPDDLKNVMKVTKEAESTLSNASFYHRIVTRDGDVRKLHSHAHYEFDANGNPIGLFGVAHDVTEQTDNIIQLKLQNEQLEDIAWIQSHKVRGPLATILGLAQQFEESDSPEETEAIIQGILITSQKLDAVIHEIVDKTSASEISNTYHIEHG